VVMNVTVDEANCWNGRMQTDMRVTK
jgi:hypothetical protein